MPAKGNKDMKRKKSSLIKAAASKSIATTAVQSSFLKNAGVKKESKVKMKKSSWSNRMNALRRDKILDASSKEAPLKHFERLQETLQEIDSEIQHERHNKKRGKAELNRNKVKSSGGRRLALERERSQFNKVLAHPAFQNNPVQTIHNHLMAKYQNIAKK